jgi:hypothetical protein
MAGRYGSRGLPPDPLLLKASVDSVSVWMLSLMTEKAISPSGTTNKK